MAGFEQRSDTNRLEGSKEEDQNIRGRWENIIIIQVRNDWGESVKMMGSCLMLHTLLKVELTVFSDGFNMGCEMRKKKRKQKTPSQVSSLSETRSGAATDKADW